jgi:hypothetical protein
MIVSRHCEDCKRNRFIFSEKPPRIASALRSDRGTVCDFINTTPV